MSFVSKFKNLTGFKKFLATCALLFGVLISISLVFLVLAFRQVSPDQAQADCQNLLQAAKSQISKLEGYDIIAEGKSCNSTQDEIAKLDYNLRAYFRLSKTDQTDITKADIDGIIKNLPPTDFSLRVQNEPKIDGRPATLCVSTSRYLNDDGAYIEQSYESNRGGFVDAQALPQGYFSGCSELPADS